MPPFKPDAAVSYLFNTTFLILTLCFTEVKQKYYVLSVDWQTDKVTGLENTGNGQITRIVFINFLPNSQNWFKRKWLTSGRENFRLKLQIFNDKNER